MKSFFDKEVYQLDDIQHLIDNKIEEGIYIEFKSAPALSTEQNKKAEIGKDVSAFANSYGGCIIYGLKEKKGRADDFDYIDSNAFSKDWLQSVIDSNAQRNIPDILIFPISKPNEPEKQIFVIKIPTSKIGPHMAKDNKYYRRTNKGNHCLEEIDVREHYFRIKKTELTILPVIGADGDFYDTYNSYVANSTRPIHFHMKFNIKNIGATIEHYYKFEFSFPANLSGYGPGLIMPKHYVHRMESNIGVYTVGNQHPIFQDEISEVAETRLKITPHNFSVFKEAKIKLKLYYTNEVITQESNLKDILTIRGNLIDSNSFSLKN